MEFKPGDLVTPTGQNEVSADIKMGQKLKFVKYAGDGRSPYDFCAVQADDLNWSWGVQLKDIQLWEPTIVAGDPSLQVKIKRLNTDAVIPKYAKDGDAGLDLVATNNGEWNIDGNVITYHTGLAFEIPKGFVGLIYPRSSICKYDLELTNSVGVIDSGYRGELCFKFRLTAHIGTRNLYKLGDKIGQIIIVPYPQVTLVEAETLSDSERGTNGFGSSGT